MGSARNRIGAGLSAWLSLAGLLAALGCSNKPSGGALHDASLAADGGGMLRSDAGDGGSVGDAAADGGRMLRPDAGDTTDAGGGVDAAISSDEDAGPATLSESAFAAALASAFCKSLDDSACCAKGTAGCVAEVSTEIKDMIAMAKAHQNVFSPVQAAACVAAVQALPSVKCVPWFASSELSLGACSATLDGVIAPGDACGDVEQCRRGEANGTVPGGFVGCSQFDSAGAKRCRAFVPTTTLGASCEMGFKGSAATVNVCAGGLTCTSSQCEAQPVCSGSAPSGTCTGSNVCVSGVCKAPGVQGADCTTIPCATGLSCDATMHCAADAKAPWIVSIGFRSTTYACPN